MLGRRPYFPNHNNLKLARETPSKIKPITKQQHPVSPNQRRESVKNLCTSSSCSVLYRVSYSHPTARGHSLMTWHNTPVPFRVRVGSPCSSYHSNTDYLLLSILRCGRSQEEVHSSRSEATWYDNSKYCSRLAAKQWFSILSQTAKPWDLLFSVWPFPFSQNPKCHLHVHK